MFISEAEEVFLAQCVRDMMDVVKGGKTRGIHPKLAKRLLPILGQITDFGGDVGEYKRKRLSQRTYADHNQNTMFID